MVFPLQCRSDRRRDALYRLLTIVCVPLWAASNPFPAWFTVRKTRMCETPFGR
jgi:hypothetical protein